MHQECGSKNKLGESVGEKMKKGMLLWFGHVEGMQEERITN